MRMDSAYCMTMATYKVSEGFTGLSTPPVKEMVYFCFIDVGTTKPICFC